jgi:NADPH-dependent curcumin reductase CurA
LLKSKTRGGNAMSDHTNINRQVLLVEKPAGKLGPEHFKMSEAAIPEPKDGEALLRVRYISLDAANRAWMHGATYRAAVEANTVMAGGGIAEVVSSKAPGVAPGDIVFGDTGWQTYAAVPAKHLTKMPKIEPMTHLLSVYGIAGLTAYFGLIEIGKPKAGETVVVSAAAGSVGSIVGRNRRRQRQVQLADIRTRFRRCRRLQGRRGVQGAARRRAKRHRCLFRQCWRRHSRSLPGADE